MSDRYVRPVLCRLCGFPAPDGGVPVSQLDRRQLSEWCLRKMNPDLDQEGLEKAIVCHFCVSDARFEIHSRSSDADSRRLDYGLWDNIGKSKFGSYFFEHSIQPCAVKMDILPPKQIALHALSGSSIRLPASVAPIKKKAIGCNYLHCSTFFHTETDKKKHLLEKHDNRKYKARCVYCKNCVANLEQHVQYHHKTERTFRCIFTKFCVAYFLSEQERQDHISEVHTGLECIYCKISYKGSKGVHSHMRIYHSDVKIKCKKYGCALYFHTKEDQDQHFQKVHTK